MSRIRSNNIVILCADDQAELPILSSMLSSQSTAIVATTLSQLELALTDHPSASLILSWQKPTAELRYIVGYCRRHLVATVVLLKDINTLNNNDLSDFNQVVILPYIAVTSLLPMLTHAQNNRQSALKTRTEISLLKNKLEERKWVEKAKGLLMKVHSIDESEAYKALRSSAMKHSQSMGIVARNLVNSFELMN